MAATTISVRWRGRACSFVRLLTATALLAAIGACGRAGAPDDALPADGVPAPSDAGPAAAAESPDGSAADERPSADRVILDGEELPPELAAAFRQAIGDRAPRPAGVAERLPGRRGPNAEAAPSPADVGPDWSVVEEYLGRQRAWMESNRQRPRPSRDASSGERVRAMADRLAGRPDVSRAVAAAKAILAEDGAHERTVEAAEFLVVRTQSGRDVDENMYAGAKALLAHAPDYESWPRVLSAMDGMWFLGPAIDTFFEELAAGADDPAAARRRPVLRGGRPHAHGKRVAQERAGAQYRGPRSRDGA